LGVRPSRGERKNKHCWGEEGVKKKKNCELDVRVGPRIKHVLSRGNPPRHPISTGERRRKGRLFSNYLGKQQPPLTPRLGKSARKKIGLSTGGRPRGLDWGARGGGSWGSFEPQHMFKTRKRKSKTRGGSTGTRKKKQRHNGATQKKGLPHPLQNKGFTDHTTRGTTERHKM